MTANASRGEVRYCLDAGMNDYLAKPVTKASVQEALARWVTHGSAAQAERAPGAAIQSPAESMPVFDRDAVFARLGGCEALLAAAVRSFVDRVPVVEELERVLQAQHAALLFRHLHAMLGSSAAVAAAEVQSVLVVMNPCAEQGDLAGVRQRRPHLQHKLARFVAAGVSSEL